MRDHPGSNGSASPSDRERLLALFNANRPRFSAGGWRLSTVLAIPALAVRAVLFPPDPPAWAPDAPPLPLLPRQRAVADRLAKVSRPLPPIPRHVPVPPRRRTGPSTFQVRNGALLEPLHHHAHGPRRPRPIGPQDARNDR